MTCLFVLLPFVALAGGGFAVLLAIVIRNRTYKRLLKYDPKQDFISCLPSSAVEAILIRSTSNGFLLPDLPSRIMSGLLELNVETSVGGSWFDPFVQIEAPGFLDRQFLDRGARGIRFLNVSRLLRSGATSGQPVAMSGRHIAWQTNPIRLHLCREMLQPADRVLVVAPHPDDAEIAAFGLYADTHATIVTISAGDASDRYSGGDGENITLSRNTIATMRVWDSITVPQLVGIPQERAINLCYPDGYLRTMCADPLREFSDLVNDDFDFLGLRRINRSSLVRGGATCSWVSLVGDLVEILATVRPTVIATPHPWLDPHTDHAFTSGAVCEAMKSVELTDGRFYFYINHNRRSELWPFGRAGSGVALMPLFEDDLIQSEGFYSHALSPERQREKFLALEAMHDLRDLGSPEPRSARSHFRRIRAEFAGALHGIGVPPTSYLRRAVRPDEVFLVASFAAGQELCERSLHQL